jgi:hypothetical protein
MNNRFPGRCPVCGSEMTVVRLHCHSCDTSIEGQFSQPINPLSQLSAEQVNFLMAFIRCEGRFNRLENELGFSYPTLRNRFNEILRTLGFEPTQDETPIRLTADDRRKVLEELEKGVIDFTEAQRRLRSRKVQETGPDSPQI